MRGASHVTGCLFIHHNESEKHQLTSEEWAAIYTRFKDGELPAWEEWLEVMREILQKHPCVLPEPRGRDFGGRLKRAKKEGATGGDGWRTKEASELPEVILERVARIFTGIEKGGAWPIGLLFGLVALLGKVGLDPTKGGPTKLRPITILSIWYRTYASIRYRQLQDWQQLWLHPCCKGGVPGGPGAPLST